MHNYTLIHRVRGMYTNLSLFILLSNCFSSNKKKYILFFVLHVGLFLLMLPYLVLKKNSAFLMMSKPNRNRLIDCRTQMFILIVNFIFLIHFYLFLLNIQKKMNEGK